jgi:transcription termination factor Rho
MSYRERRALRRNDRLQNRPPRLGPDGQPLPPLPYIPNSENRGGEGREPREPRPDRFEGRNDRYERGEGRPERGERFDGRGERFERQQRRRDLDLQSLEAMGDEELRALCAEMNVEIATAEGEQLDKATLVMALLEAQAQSQNATLKKGILDIINDNKAYLRCDGYHPGESDVYVSNTQIKRFNLKPGDMVLGSARAPKDNERYYGLLRVEAVNGLPVEVIRYRRDFEKLTPIFPTERYVLETGPSNITARIIDLVSPVGKGQRGLIVAPPKAGKTTLIKSIANSITANYPDVKLFVLLIDERPEEVTDISRSVNGEVIASTFDETPDNHMRVADIVMERAKRLAEMKHDVVILMDSITRLSRASNLVVSPSGRTLSGGLDPAAMYKPKRMFGAARNLEEGGSLTILATALVDTGSRMDEMIFEEFKGTGNMDLVLDRDLFNQRIFPAIDINRSGTRRDDLLMSADELTATYHLRRTLAQLDNDKAVTLLIDRLKNTKSNGHFMEVVAKSARQQQNGTPTT